MFAQSILFARIFLPEQLGAFATAMLVVSFASLFGQAGFDQAVIRERNDPKPRLDTASFLSLGIALILVAVLFALSPVVASVMGNPELAAYIRFLSFTVFGSLLMLPGTLWIRDYRFGVSKLPMLVDVVVTTAVTLTAFYSFRVGLWSLFVGKLAGFFAHYAFLWTIAPYRPRFRFDPQVGRSLWGFGWPLMVGSIANYFIYSGDDLLVRYFGGDEQLAFYTLAFALPFYLKEATDVGIAALLPSYARIQDSIKDIEHAFSMANRYLTVLLAPAGIALAVFADPIIRVVYGENWLPTVPLLRVFALSFTLDVTLGYSWGIVALARGKTRYLMYARVLNVLVLLVGGTFLISRYGPMGGALYTIGQVVLFVVTVRCPFVYSELGSLGFLKPVWRPLTAALAAGGLSHAAAGLLPPALPGLFLGLALLLAAYALALFLFDRSSLRVFRDIAHSVQAGRPGFAPRA